MTRRRILIATPRAITAARLTREITALPHQEVIGTVADLSAAYVLAESHEPSLVLLGAELIRQAEFEGLLSLFRVTGSAWLRIETDTKTGIPLTEGTICTGLSRDDLAQRLRLAKVPKQVRSYDKLAVPPLTSRETRDSDRRPGGYAADRLILIGASTGGIDALLTLLATFPADCPPTVIVQHTGSGFSDSLIRLFDRCSAARVVAAAPDIDLTPGLVMVAAGCEGHLRIAAKKPWRCSLQPGPAISGHMPSVDALFRSAVPYAPQVAAALLTGMGRDGAQGLLELRRGGSATFAQNEDTAVVYGMPRAAVELGAAQASLPLDRIAATLLDHCRSRGEAQLIK